VELNAYQTLSAKRDVRPDPDDPVFPLLGLSGEVGSLVAEYKKRMRAGGTYVRFEDQVREELGDLLWYLAAMARTMGLSLEEVAEQNLRKIDQAFATRLPPAPRYDVGFPRSERFPRTFRAAFVPHRTKGLKKVAMYLVGGDQLGDTLDDNSYEDDQYRFHDVMHLAHASVLGWSPLARKLLNRKRRSVKKVDRVEDGARSVFLEEGLVAFVFTEAREYEFYSQAERVDWDLLKTLARMTRHLEVSDQPPIAWQSAILQGFKAFRALGAAGGGVVECDLTRRRIAFAGSLEDVGIGR
jgi:NTP pyrophosphatase (non-canonical NTP hydrolase)